MNWSYSGEAGPDNWANLDSAYVALWFSSLLSSKGVTVLLERIFQIANLLFYDKRTNMRAALALLVILGLALASDHSDLRKLCNSIC